MKKIEWNNETREVYEIASQTAKDQSLRFADGGKVKFAVQLEDDWHTGYAIKRNGGIEIRVERYRLFSDGCDLYLL